MSDDEPTDGPGDGDGGDAVADVDGDGDAGARLSADDAGEEPSTEDEIRWAAFEVLVGEGYDAFTTQKVADAAGVSQSLVHYYYDTKADLVYALFANGLDHLADEIASRVDAEDPRERLLELARYMLRGEGQADFEAAVEFSRMLLEIDAQAPYDERLRDAVEYDVDFLREYVADAVREGVESGQFREVDPEAFAAVYVGAVRSGQNLRAIFADDDPVAPVLAGVEALVTDYLAREGDP